MGEPVPAAGAERGTGHHHRRYLRVQLLAEGGADQAERAGPPWREAAPAGPPRHGEPRGWATVPPYRANPDLASRAGELAPSRGLVSRPHIHPRSLLAASVPRRSILQPNSPLNSTCGGPTNLRGTNHRSLARCITGRSDVTLARMSQGPPPLRRSGQGSPPLPPGPPSRAVKCIRGDVIALWGTAPRRTFGPHVYISRVCGVWDCRARRFTQVEPGAAQAAG